MLHDHFQQAAPPRQRGDVSLPPSLIRGGIVLLAVLLATSLEITKSHAAGARQAVDAAPGEIVMTRDVPARHAIRQAPEGNALLMDVGPEEQVQELTDGDYMSISSHRTTHIVKSFTAGLTGSAPQAAGRSSSGMPDPSRAVMNVPATAMSGATRAAGDQVMGALQGAGLLGK